MEIEDLLAGQGPEFRSPSIAITLRFCLLEIMQLKRENEVIRIVSP